MPFGVNIDIRDTVNYKEVMKQYNLGPNGGILTSLNLFATRFDQVISYAEEKSADLKYVLKMPNFNQYRRYPIVKLSSLPFAGIYWWILLDKLKFSRGQPQVLLIYVSSSLVMPVTSHMCAHCRRHHHRVFGIYLPNRHSLRSRHAQMCQSNHIHEQHAVRLQVLIPPPMHYLLFDSLLFPAVSCIRQSCPWCSASTRPTYSMQAF